MRYAVLGLLLLSLALVSPTSSGATGACTTSDLNGDGTVNIFDLAIWASGLPPGYSACSDYNCDGIVDVFDLAIFASGI
jgi:hypothetical protein